MRHDCFCTCACANNGQLTSHTQGDEEAPEEEVQIDDDPDLNSPPFGSKGRIKAAFNTIQAPPAPPRTQPFAPPYAGRPVPEEYGFAWKVRLSC